MDSKIATAIRSKYAPVALIFSDERPEEAKQFKPGKWGCVMWLLASAAKGQTAVVDETTFGCIGGGVGLGFGNQYENWPGGIECFYYFLSTGNLNSPAGQAILEKVKPFLREESYENFVHGEGFIKTPELVKKFVDCLPICELPTKYLLMKPISDVDPAKETPEAVVFLADADQLAALVILANYGRDDNLNVIIPQAAGCQGFAIYAYQEAKSENPRAVVGLMDISARLNIRKQLGDNLLSFSIPWRLFQEMETNVSGSFLGKPAWQELLERKTAD